jgi:cellulose biosynthesis protein BcsQ
LPGPARVVVLGCTAGAGQTVVTLLTGQSLASLRGEAVAVLDLAEGEGSLTERARSIPVLLPSARAGADPASRGASPGERGLHVVSAAGSDAGHIIDSVVERYPLVLADPDAGSVPKSLRVTDQLILVAPASQDAANALATTLEWLEANGYGGLAEATIIVLNGVSSATSQHAAKAAAVASGRCRAIVQVPWDERLRGPAAHPLATPTVRAYTALAGVVVAGLAAVTAGSEAR